ncbi:MAG: type I DNA topoisomerase [Bacteroidota bacterium]|nr:type I DNA topoisomerase [Bacteroidota bacterium]
MAKNLVIVESPAKAKTIEGFLGKDFLVKSSFGHVRDLVKKGMAVDTENKFQPKYEISPDKEKVVNELKKLSKESQVVWLATDEDREGEAISWHLSEALGLDEKKTRRIVFHEITKSAILHAIETPRSIDKHLVDAQQARRILDRLVGFELSPILWKKIKPSLSAGRVQSVAVRLIVEREREVSSHKSVSSYKVSALFNSSGNNFKAELKNNFTTADAAREFLEKCRNAIFTITSLETKPAKKTPSAPFTTSTLQQEASRKLGFSVKRTMVVAQRLYESGKITYMRTDSVNLSETALDQARVTIGKNYGEKYINIRTFKTKSKGAQEAHEAIRPTYLEHTSVDAERDEARLYDLIWKRTIASQMADAELEKTTAIISVSTATENFVAQGEVIKFDGFLKIYMESSDEDEENTDETKEGMLPALKLDQKLDVNAITATQRFTHHPSRFTEASLVKKLEELGIGRPSTYAPTISTVQDRGYVVKEDREGKPRNFDVFTLKNKEITEEVRTENTGAEKSKLFPTDIGMVVTDFLNLHFPNIMDYHFTAKVEMEFDEIAEGKVQWQKMLESFYKPFHQTVEQTEEKSERASGERLLGVHPESGKNIYARIGRFGPLVQIGEADEKEKKFASLKKDQRLEAITLEDALELFKLPRVGGQFEEKDMKIAIGRFGPYIQHNSLFFSIPKDDDPHTLTPERAVEIILAKRKSDAEKEIKSFRGEGREDVRVLNGRWGPYFCIGKSNYKIPKDREPVSLTLAECLALAEDQEKNMPPYKRALLAKKAALEAKRAPKGKKAKAPAVKKVPAVKRMPAAEPVSGTKAKPAKKAAKKKTAKKKAVRKK